MAGRFDACQANIFTVIEEGNCMHYNHQLLHKMEVRWVHRDSTLNVSKFEIRRSHSQKSGGGIYGLLCQLTLQGGLISIILHTLTQVVVLCCSRPATNVFKPNSFIILQSHMEAQSWQTEQKRPRLSDGVRFISNIASEGGALAGNRLRRG